ncbi:hypothetical protein D4R99_01930 [bacterium]|nr:MAG: hypothetical protein D4R99_01930 [bacterium]
MGYDGGGCIASRMSGSVCPMNVLQMTFHHISAFQVFSLSSAVFFAGFLLFFLSAFVFSSLFIKILSFYPPKFLRRLRKEQKKSSLFQKQKITGWLALFEHSPSLI